jgi:hypothetical protein
MEVTSMKKLLVLILCLGLVATMALGCSQKSETTTGTKEETGKQTEETKENVDKTTYAPIVVDKDKKEVSFKAKVKKPEHPAGDDPLKLAAPNAIINEQSGSALPAAALVAEEGVNAKLLTVALESLGLKAGKNLVKGQKDGIAEGDPVKVEIEINGTRVLWDDILKAGNPNVQTKYVFLGCDDVQQQMGCGCLLCGRSGPGTVIANSVYTTTQDAPIGPTAYAGLKAKGANDGDEVTVIISRAE